jgi:hypothetical protein
LVSPAFVSSSFPGRNYHGPSSRDAAACEPAALCVPVHSISTVPRGRERATTRLEEEKSTKKWRRRRRKIQWKKHPSARANFKFRGFGFWLNSDKCVDIFWICCCHGRSFSF